MNIIVVINNKTSIRKELIMANFTDEQINEILYFYNNRGNKDYEAYVETV